MSAPAGEALHELGADDLEAARGLINDTIERGQLPGVHVEWLSCFNLDTTADAPAHEPGWRWFLITIHATEKKPHTTCIFFSAMEPGTDYVRMPIGALLGNVAGIEQSLGEVDALANDMATEDGRAALLKYEGQSTAAVLRVVERTSNRRLDALRAIAGDPTKWPPISSSARLFGVLEMYGTRSAAE